MVVCNEFDNRKDVVLVLAVAKLIKPASNIRAQFIANLVEDSVGIIFAKMSHVMQLDDPIDVAVR